MDGYLQTGLGVFVSIVLFIIGYKQTIGAKKERAKNANASVHRAILRRMVLENYSPKLQDLTKIIEGKSREFKVSINDLLTEEQFLINLYTEVFDSELIPTTQRNEIESKIEKCLETSISGTQPISDIDYQQLSLENKKRKNYVALLAATTSIIGATATLLFSFSFSKSFNIEWLMSGVGVFITSLFLLYVLGKFRKIKESDTPPSKLDYRLSASVFERKIGELIEKLGFEYEIEPKIDERYRGDFKVNVGKKKILIEAKSWDDNVPLSIYKRTINQLLSISEKAELDEILLVVKKRPNISMKNFDAKNIKMLTLNELSSYLKNAA